MPRRTKMIPVEREDIPRFASEAEEHQYWKTHTFGPGLLAEMRPDFDAELPSPDEMRTVMEQRRVLRNRSVPTPIRFDADVLRRVRALAQRKGTGYQTLLKQFVIERLYEEEKREGLV